MMKRAPSASRSLSYDPQPRGHKKCRHRRRYLVARDAEGFSTITKPAEREDVKGFLQNEIGLEELFVDNLLHN